ncbi:MAG TPA: cytochrome C [Candidatus Binatia bacterium]|nr:cytochrome C [Candidatus Binatia bacterium]
MTKTSGLALVAALVVALGGGWLARSRAEAPHHAVPPSADGNLVVGLCDGVTSAEVQGVKEGERLTRSQAQAVSDQLMEEWRRKNPQANWDDARAVHVAQAAQGGALEQSVPPPEGSRPGASIKFGGAGAAEGAREAAQTKQGGAPQGQTGGGAGGMPAGPQGPVQDGHTYGAFSQRDVDIWKAATDEFVAQGDRIFHSADLLGGTIGVSCDMCHPNAANTHPETYPKFQVQFGRVALLRDMINWCIENPVRGKPLPDDDFKLRALEAYILAQRRGVPLEYGKH